METVVVHELGTNTRTGIMEKKISFNNPKPRDVFKETHKEFSREEKKAAEFNYKNSK